jgi:superfamily II DNA or RNA helicase
MKALYAYQKEKIAELEKIYEMYPDDQRAFLQMVVGAGKTFAALNFAIQQLKGSKPKSVVWVVHQTGLADQSASDFRDDFKLQGGQLDKSLKKGKIENITFHFMTWQALRGQILKGSMNAHDMLIIDEAHYGSSNNGQTGKNGDHLSFKKIFSSKLFKKHLYVSATPWDLNPEVFPGLLSDDKRSIRHDRAAILTMKEAHKLNLIADVVFNVFHSADTLKLKHIEDKENSDEVSGESTKDLAKQAASKTIDFSHSKSKQSLYRAIVESVIEGYLRLEGGASGKDLPPTIIFCNGIKDDPRSIEAVMKIIKLKCKSLYGAKFNTERSLVACAHSAMNVEDDGRANDAINDFRAGKIKILCVANMAQEGFNYPELQVAIDLCPSLKNIRRRTQRIGRIIRKKADNRAARYYYADTITNYIRIKGQKFQISEASKDRIADEISEYDGLSDIKNEVSEGLTEAVANAKMAAAQIILQDEASENVSIESPYLGTESVEVSVSHDTGEHEAESIQLFNKEKKIKIQRTRVGFIISDAYLSNGKAKGQVRSAKLSEMLEKTRAQINWEEWSIEDLVAGYHGTLKAS